MHLTTLRLLDLYSKRVKELKEQGVTNPFGEGYYKVNSVESVKIYDHWVDLLVTAQWKPLNSKEEESVPLLIRLGNLYSRESKGPKELDPRELRNTIIQIDQVEVYDQEYDNKIKRRFKAVWKILKPKDESKEPSVNNIETLDQGDSFIRMTDSKQMSDIMNSKPNFQ